MTKEITYWIKKRQALNLTQTEFWSRVGATQSCGSRYENGRRIPRPVVTLLTIAYGTERQADEAVAKLRWAANA